MAESNTDKKHPPTPHRLREARRRGEVPHASETVTAAAAVVAVMVLAVLGSTARDRFGDLLDQLLLLVRHRPGADATGLALRVVAQALAEIVVPIVVVPAVAALLVAFVVSGPVMSARPLTPRFERMNPAAGLGRILSIETLFRVAKGGVTVGLLIAAGAALVSAWAPALARLWRADAGGALAASAGMLVTMLGALALLALALSLPDLLFQRWYFRRQHRMDDTELRREFRDQEGDPYLRGERRRLHRESTGET